MSAFNFIRSSYGKGILLKKMSEIHPKEHEDYQNEIKKKETAKSIKSCRGRVSGLHRSGLTRPMKLSPELADIVGKKFASRAECISGLWAYLKENNLMDPESSFGVTDFTPDAKLAKIFGNDKIRSFSMAKFLSAHWS